MRGRGRRRLYTPRRVDVVELLEEGGMLPAIYFIFSRAACSDAAAACLDAGLRLTTAAERDRIREIVGARLRGIDDADLAVLGYARWLAGLEAGVAPHHAGLVPPFKEAVEACFVEGLVKVVFATETLALGINMPARSVVIEKLTKFTGERHQFLTPGEYTQLTGRAGRRGIDTLGHAIVLWSPFVPFDQVAGLASSRTFKLSSAFRPTYNMAVNLVRSYPPEEAHHLLNLSFGQYQADRDVVRLEARLERRREVLADLREAAQSPFGDLDDYRRTHPRRERRPSGVSEAEIVASLARLKPGDVIVLQSGKHAGPRRGADRRAAAWWGSARARHHSLAHPCLALGARLRRARLRRRPRGPAHSVRARTGSPTSGRLRASSSARASSPTRRPRREPPTDTTPTTRSFVTRSSRIDCGPQLRLTAPPAR